MRRQVCWLLKVWVPVWLWLAAGLAMAQPAQWSPLLEVDALVNLLDGPAKVRVVHVTGDARDGVIPGAVRASYAAFRGPASNAGQLPPLPQLQTLLQQLDSKTQLLGIPSQKKALKSFLRKWCSLNLLSA
jgi:hypothetical protein